jgi:hypothetical protein
MIQVPEFSDSAYPKVKQNNGGEDNLAGGSLFLLKTRFIPRNFDRD